MSMSEQQNRPTAGRLICFCDIDGTLVHYPSEQDRWGSYTGKSVLPGCWLWVDKVSFSAVVLSEDELASFRLHSLMCIYTCLLSCCNKDDLMSLKVIKVPVRHGSPQVVKTGCCSPVNMLSYVNHLQASLVGSSAGLFFCAESLTTVQSTKYWLSQLLAEHCQCAYACYAGFRETA